MATADMAVDQMPAGYMASLLLSALSATALAVVAVSARYESAYRCLVGSVTSSAN